MKLCSWKQASSQCHVTTSCSLGRLSGISPLKYPVVLRDIFSPKSELINVWLLVIMKKGRNTY